MTVQDIKDAIKAGKTVHYANTGYTVQLDPSLEQGMCNGLGLTFTSTTSAQYYTGLHPNEVKDCFIAE
jgi:hypothetical protein